MADNTRSIQCVVIGQSLQVDHVLVVDVGGRPYALTKNRFPGDWISLRRGDVVEITVSCEPLPQTLSGRLLARRGSEAMNASAFESRIGTVLGIGTDPPYVLVECHDANQYVVNQRVFAGDWNALQQGDVVALIVTRGDLGRVLHARLAGSHGSSAWD